MNNRKYENKLFSINFNGDNEQFSNYSRKQSNKYKARSTFLNNYCIKIKLKVITIIPNIIPKIAMCSFPSE